MTSSRIRLLAILVTASLFIAGCGGGDDSDDGGDSGEAGGTSVTVEGTDAFKFAPDSWTAAAGQNVTVAFSNTGAIEHDWVILEVGTNIDSSTDYDESSTEFALKATGGTSVSGTFNLPAGTYQVICAVPGHLEAGMEGTLIVGD